MFLSTSPVMNGVKYFLFFAGRVFCSCLVGL